jgi:CheY-like chemotaxis protein
MQANPYSVAENMPIEDFSVHEGAYMSGEKKPIVLLIEPDAALRRLITLGLEHRGMHVVEANSPTHLPPFDPQQLDLLVLDLDGETARNRTFLSSAHALLARPHFSTLPTILLAWEYPSSLSTTQSSVATESTIKYLTKPFDARILHKTLDQFLLARAAAEAAREARAEELLLATYKKHTSPSIWPLITAAGLLLAFIGMMLQLAVTIVGVLVVVIALLLWTLGSRTEPDSIVRSTFTSPALEQTRSR